MYTSKFVINYQRIKISKFIINNSNHVNSYQNIYQKRLCVNSFILAAKIKQLKIKKQQLGIIKNGQHSFGNHIQHIPLNIQKPESLLIKDLKRYLLEKTFQLMIYSCFDFIVNGSFCFPVFYCDDCLLFVKKKLYYNLCLAMFYYEQPKIQ